MDILGDKIVCILYWLVDGKKKLKVMFKIKRLKYVLIFINYFNNDIKVFFFVKLYVVRIYMLLEFLYDICYKRC